MNLYRVLSKSSKKILCNSDLHLQWRNNLSKYPHHVWPRRWQLRALKYRFQVIYLAETVPFLPPFRKPSWTFLVSLEQFLHHHPDHFLLWLEIFLEYCQHWTRNPNIFKGSLCNKLVLFQLHLIAHSPWPYCWDHLEKGRSNFSKNEWTGKRYILTWTGNKNKIKKNRKQKTYQLKKILM